MEMVISSNKLPSSTNTSLGNQMIGQPQTGEFASILAEVTPTNFDESVKDNLTDSFAPLIEEDMAKEVEASSEEASEKVTEPMTSTTEEGQDASLVIGNLNYQPTSHENEALPTELLAINRISNTLTVEQEKMSPEMLIDSSKESHASSTLREVVQTEANLSKENQAEVTIKPLHNLIDEEPKLNEKSEFNLKEPGVKQENQQEQGKPVSHEARETLEFVQTTIDGDKENKNLEIKPMLEEGESFQGEKSTNLFTNDTSVASGSQLQQLAKASGTQTIEMTSKPQSLEQLVLGEKTLIKVEAMLQKPELGSGEIKVMRMQLEPAQLGELEVTLEVIDGQIKGKLIVANQQVKELFEKSLPLLELGNNKQSVSLSNIQVEVQNQLGNSTSFGAQYQQSQYSGGQKGKSAKGNTEYGKQRFDEATNPVEVSSDRVDLLV